MDSSDRILDDSSRLNVPLHFVAPSLLRVRRFLFEQGMPIVPWASAGEVLDQFYDLLDSHHAEDQFWHSVSELLESLQFDLRERLEGDAQNNEVLTHATQSVLLDEIRERLRSRESMPGGFLALARRLSPKSLTVWLLLGSAATVSCGAQVEDRPGMDSTGQTSGGSSGTGGSNSTGGNPSAGTGGQTVISVPGNTPCNRGTFDASAIPNIESVAAQCTVAGAAQNEILACMAILNQSWRDGMQSLLNCTTCDEAAYYLNALVNTCSNLSVQYDPCLLRFCGTPIYNGVRMD